MRKLSLAVAALVAAAAFGPVSPASAFCWEPYYSLTGDCSPCDEIDAFADRTLDKVGLGHSTECLD